MTDSDYPWEVIPDPDAGGYTIRFPDLPGCMTCVETLYHIGNVAAEIRDLWLETAREAGMAIPEPGSYEANTKRLHAVEHAVRALHWDRRKDYYYIHLGDMIAGGDDIDTLGRLLDVEQ